MPEAGAKFWRPLIESDKFLVEMAFHCWCFGVGFFGVFVWSGV
jgi:hypothetical protein